MKSYAQRLYRPAVAALLTAIIIVLGPTPEEPVTVWSSIWIYLVCLVWSGFVGQIFMKVWRLLHLPSQRSDTALSLAIMTLGLIMIGFIWVSLAAVLGFWASIFSMVPVFGLYAFIDWIVRHRDDFDTSLKP